MGRAASSGSTSPIRPRTASPFTSPKTYDIHWHGKRIFEVRATDAAGNADPMPATFDWKVKKKKKK